MYSDCIMEMAAKVVGVPRELHKASLVHTSIIHTH